jgi:hypothetical protein
MWGRHMLSSAYHMDFPPDQKKRAVRLESRLSFKSEDKKQRSSPVLLCSSSQMRLFVILASVAAALAQPIGLAINTPYVIHSLRGCGPLAVHNVL